MHHLNLTGEESVDGVRPARGKGALESDLRNTSINRDEAGADL